MNLCLDGTLGCSMLLTFNLRWNEAVSRMRRVLNHKSLKLCNLIVLFDILDILNRTQLIENFSDDRKRTRGRDKKK